MRPVPVLSPLVFVGALAVAPLAAEEPNGRETTRGPDFARDIFPIFQRRCVRCHGPQKERANLRLDTRARALRGGVSGRVIVPGSSTQSLLFRAVAGHAGDLLMPPGRRRLPSGEVERIGAWIDAGARWPDRLAGDTGEAADHWAYQRPARRDPPTNAQSDWPRNPIDRFVLRRLEEEGVEPSGAADRASLLRRVSLDLTGLPPTVEELDRFLRDDAPDAYERLVDRLLASPAYGERWASLWLDLARYADTQGYEKDNRRTAWRYRDWVIDAFCRDLPFDQFTVEQLAGDLLDAPTVEQLTATAFHRNTMTNTEGGTDDEEFRVAAVVDRVNTTMQVWMGTTIGCAQCHNHKYDPFTQREYFELFAFFNQTEDADRPDDAPTIPTPTREELERIDTLRRELDLVSEKLRDPLPSLTLLHEWRERRVLDLLAKVAARWKLLDRRRELRARLRGVRPTTTPILRELPSDRRRETHLLVRGSFLEKGERVEPAVPRVLHEFPPDAPRDRLGLARWLVSGDNPLTARVLVNRIWEQYFGLGLVRTSEDFGTRGEQPSHPMLLDWLATEVERTGWSLKALHRLIVTSATYRQSSRVTPELLERDPYNRLLARGPRVRLTAEMVRDQALALSGLLCRKRGGPSVMPPQPPGVWQVVYSGDRWKTSDAPERYRRALYTFWRRTSPYPSMVTFDAPSREICVLRRTRTNTPLQALVTLNDPVYVELGGALAAAVLEKAPPTASPEVVAALLLRHTLLREPSEKEATRVAALFEEQVEEYLAAAGEARDLLAACGLADKVGPADDRKAAELAAWAVVGNALLNLDETLTKE